MADETLTIKVCGPSRGACVCKCGHIPGKCDLPLLECLAADPPHWIRDCGHDFTGPWKEWDLPEGGREGSVTCRHCGMTAAAHDMWVGP